VQGAVRCYKNANPTGLSEIKKGWHNQSKHKDAPKS
jgi:hypothetical protein